MPSYFLLDPAFLQFVDIGLTVVVLFSPALCFPSLMRRYATCEIAILDYSFFATGLQVNSGSPPPSSRPAVISGVRAAVDACVFAVFGSLFLVTILSYI